MRKNRYKVAVVQAAPPYPPSKKETINKISKIAKEAGAQGASIIAFPETFIPAYPNWVIEAKPPTAWSKKWLDVVKESIEIPSPETDQLCKVAKSIEAIICVGVNEKDKNYSGSIYNSLVFIGPDGRVMGRHRKLTPAYREKIFWTNGLPEDLRCVFSTPFGKVGGLICAEHLNPLLKSAMAMQGEEIHIAAYPGWSLLSRNVMDTSIRQYALECQCFVLASSQYFKGKPDSSQDSEANWEFYGGSGIVDPLGNYIAGPSYDREEILYADIDLARILERKAWIDVTGKDARWDVIPFLNSLTKLK